MDDLNTQTRGATYFKSLRPRCREITHAIQNCQATFSLRKILTCYFFQLYFLKRWIYYRCILLKLFWNLPPQSMFPVKLPNVPNSYSKWQVGTIASVLLRAIDSANATNFRTPPHRTPFRVDVINVWPPNRKFTKKRNQKSRRQGAVPQVL